MTSNEPKKRLMDVLKPDSNHDSNEPVEPAAEPATASAPAPAPAPAAPEPGFESDDEEIWEPVESDIWIPQEQGESLVGEIVEFGEGQFGNFAVVRERGTGLLWRTPAHKVLQSRLSQLRLGDTIKIIYRGEIQSKFGRATRDYAVLRLKSR